MSTRASRSSDDDSSDMRTLLLVGPVGDSRPRRPSHPSSGRRDRRGRARAARGRRTARDLSAARPLRAGPDRARPAVGPAPDRGRVRAGSVVWRAGLACWELLGSIECVTISYHGVLRVRDVRIRRCTLAESMGGRPVLPGPMASVHGGVSAESCRRNLEVYTQVRVRRGHRRERTGARRVLRQRCRGRHGHATTTRASTPSTAVNIAWNQPFYSYNADSITGQRDGEQRHHVPDEVGVQLLRRGPQPGPGRVVRHLREASRTTR